MMNKYAIYHRVDSEYAYGLDEKTLVLKLRTEKDNLKKVEVYFVDKYKYLFSKEKVYSIEEMNVMAKNDLYDYYEVEIKFDMISMGYFFKLESENELAYYGNYKFFDKIEKKEDICYIPDFFTMPVLDKQDIFIVPSWTDEAVVYQIFPERFYRGDLYEKENNYKDWYKDVEMGSYHGGNLQGIIDKLSYIKELGANTIYLNPVFKADYEHKYVTENYFEIDPCFGDNEKMKELVKKAHSMDIRIVFDAVFSSSGQKHFAFKDILENQEKSEYKDWYKLNYFPVSTEDSDSFKSFAYIPLLPKFNYESNKMQSHLLDILKYWIKEYDIDGWRLDVGDEIPHSFWKKARKEVKNLKKDVVLVGEVWYDSRPWLVGDEFDSVMNYTFFGAVLNFIGKQKITAEEFIGQINRTRALYKKNCVKFMWNLIDSHDTARFLTEAKGDKDRLRLAATVQFTSVGAPTVYYGDEVGLDGGNDPYNRKPMLWSERQDSELLNYYKILSKIRKENKVLIYGETDYHFYDNENGIVGYKRYDKKNCLEVYINNSEKNYDLKIIGKKEDLLTGKTYIDKIKVKAKKALILKDVM